MFLSDQFRHFSESNCINSLKLVHILIKCHRQYGVVVVYLWQNDDEYLQTSGVVTSGVCGGVVGAPVGGKGGVPKQYN